MRRQIEHPVYQTLQLKELIGRGSYGRIYRAVSIPSGDLYAVKVIPSDSDPDALPKIQKQIRILLSTQHSNIVKCHSVELVDESVWIVMDYCEAGSLSDIMQKNKRVFEESEIKIIMAEILKALVYLHANKIMHRDIKAANILMNQNGEIKVADFGVSTLLSHTQTGRNTKTGSPFWMSPELLSKSQYTYKTDIWSLGITAIELAEGAPPYSHQHPYRAIFSIQSHPPNSLSAPNDWSPEFNDFVRQCLTVDVSHRPSAQQLLAHPFFQSQSQHLQQLYRKLSSHSVQQQFDSPCDDTVIVHSSKLTSVWEKQKQQSESPDFKENQEEENNVFGTMMINTEENGRLQPQVVQKCREGLENMSLASNSVQKNSTSESTMASVQQLYRQMEQQISKIRNKYFMKIRQVEEKNTITFEQMLRSQKAGGSLRK